MTVLKLTTSPPIEDQIKAGAIDLLREALADAEAGKVCGVIVISKETDGSWYHRTTASLSIREEIGAMEVLKWDRIARTESRSE